VSIMRTSLLRQVRMLRYRNGNARSPAAMPPSFAPLYHAHHTLNQEDLPFWLGLAAEKPGLILELGCGTGRLLIPLAQNGRAVVGLDHNLEMLSFLRQHLPASLTGQVWVFCADFLRFHLKQQFQLIFLACNTYSTLKAGERQRLLQLVHQHLAPGGLFAASLPNPLWLRRLPRQSASEVEETFLHPIDGEPVQVSSAWQRTATEFRLTWHYDHLLPDGRVERQTAEVHHSLDGPQSHLRELQHAGFVIANLWGSYDRQRWQPDSPWLIFCAQKP